MADAGRELRWKTGWWALGVLLVVVVWVLSLAPRVPGIGVQNGDKIGHFLAYGTQVLWFGWLLSRRWLWAVLLLFVAQGALLEGLQGLTDYRQPDLWDIAANSIGASIGFVIALRSGGFLQWLERWLPGGQRQQAKVAS